MLKSLRLKWAATALAALLIPRAVRSQIPEPPRTVQSPNAASLGNYGDFQVSPFTGSPDISVNLHTLKDPHFEIPISLNYDPSGVRPDVHPGWVGLNFNLSATYAVVRTVKDAPDDGPNVVSSLWQRGWVNGDVRNTLNYSATDWTSTTKLEAVSAASGILDTEPDEYNFTAPGFSGKFYLSHDGQWRVICDKPVKVELLSTNAAFPPFTVPHWTGNPWYTSGPSSKYQSHLMGFVVIDEEGTRYQYGGDNSYCEYSIEFFNQGKDTWLCNSWHLKSITRHTGQTLDFTYVRGEFVAQMYLSVYNKSSRINGGAWFSCSDWSSLISEYGAYNGKLVSPIYLSQITGKNFRAKFTSTPSTELPYTEDIFSTYVNRLIQNNQSKVDFLPFLYDCFYPTNGAPGGCDYNTTLATLLGKLKWRKLDKIEIQNGAGNLIKEFNLTFSNSVSSRLRLDKVQEKSGYEAKVLPPYEFKYSAPAGYTIPGYLKGHTDHWGFNNGKLITLSDFNAMANYGSLYRGPATDKKHYLVGSLAEIVYPTGGISKFQFEPHVYGKEVKLVRWQGTDPVSNLTAGGLRIKEIHNYDKFTNTTVKRKFYYLSTFNAASPDTATNIASSGVLGGKSQYYFNLYKPKPSAAGITVEQEIFSTQSLLPGTENSFGSHIGYSQVQEWSSSEGWIVHKFTNFDTGYPDDAPNAYIQQSSTAYIPYNSNAFKRGRLLEQTNYYKNGNPAAMTTYQYTLIGPAQNSVRGVKAELALLCNTQNKVYEATAYTINTQRFLPSQLVSYTYDQDVPGSFVSTTHSYNYNDAGQITSDLYEDSQTTPHSTNFTYTTSLTSDPFYAGMVAKNILSVVDYWQATTLQITTKKYHVTHELINNFYLPKKVESTRLSTGIKLEVEYTYDSDGNVQTYTKSDGIVRRLDYYGTTDVGKVGMIKTKTDGFGQGLPQATGYDYTPAIGLSSITDANGTATMYSYDKFNRLEAVKNSDGKERASFCYNYTGQLSPCPTMAPFGSIAAGQLELLAETSLPVTLIAFDAIKEGNSARLTWSTSMETNSDRFEIERSSDGKKWSKIGVVRSHGESSQTNQYGFTDGSPAPGENLYRLRMIDADNTFAFSRILSLYFGDNHGVVLYPNPITVDENINLNVENIGLIKSVKIFDSAGKLIQQGAPQPTIKTEKLPAGLYVIQIIFNDGSSSNHRIVKQ